MNAAQIIEAVRAKYIDCASYEDKGTITVKNKTRIKESVTRGTFSHLFVRPNLLKFQLNTEDDVLKRRFQLQSDGDSVRAIEDFEPDGIKPTRTEAYSSLHTALRTVAGVTFGVTNAVFSLLGEANPKYSLVSALDVRRAEDETINNVPSYKIECMLDPLVSIEATAWISIDTFSLQQYEQRSSYTAEYRKFVKEQTKIFFEAEGLPSLSEDSESLSSVYKIRFGEVTFNNSINVDRVLNNRPLE